MKKFIFGFFSIFLALFVFVPNSYAKVIVQEKGVVTISSDEIVNDDLFIGAESVEIYGTVNGDVYIGAGRVEIDGIINGDLFVGAATITITGKIEDDAYISGGNVIIQRASIGDSLLAGAGSLDIDKDTSIGGSLLVGSGVVDNKADVGRNFFVGAGSASLNSSVGGEVRIGAGSINIGDNTEVAGDFYYTIGEDGNADLVLPNDAIVSGTIKKIEPTISRLAEIEKTKTGFFKNTRAFQAGISLISFLGAILVGFLAIKKCQKTINLVTGQITKSLLSSLGIGFLVLVLTVPLALIIMLTGIGASLAMIALSLFGIGVYLAKLVTSLALGTWLSKQFGWEKMTTYANFVVGLLLFFILKNIHLVGGFTTLLFTSIGLGAFYKLLKN